MVSNQEQETLQLRALKLQTPIKGTFGLFTLSLCSLSSLQYDQLAVYCLPGPGLRACAAGFTYHAAPQCLPRSVCEPILSLSHYSWSGAS